MTASWRDIETTEHPAFDEFVKTIACLRAPDGCPWDREQTHESIARNMIEEAYEAVDAIESRDTTHLREELGDVLMQVVLQSQIAEDAGEFTIDDVCREVNEKLVRRHPHVFGEAAADDSSAVLELWDQVKLAEKGAADAKADEAGAERESLLDAVPKAFPSLLQAQKISKKAVAVGFEWETLDDVWAQVDEEVAELKEAFARAPKNAKGKVENDTDVELELGDVLFSLVNVARKMGVDAESALRATCRKFRSRWSFMEGAAWAQGRRLDGMTQPELENLWKQAKAAELSA
jgi:tetrapyrrole methylase family protein/MazG family protein